MPLPIRRSIACLEGNTPTTQLRLLELSFHTPHRDAQSLYVQGLVLSFGFCLLASVFVAIATTVARLVVCPASSSSTCSNITVCTTSSSSVRAIPLTTLLLHYWGASLTPLFETQPFTGGFWKQNACLVVFSRQFERLVVNQIIRKHPVWYQLPTSQENHHESRTAACGFADSR